MDKHTIEIKYHGWYEMFCVVINGVYDVENMFETEDQAQEYVSTLREVEE